MAGNILKPGGISWQILQGGEASLPFPLNTFGLVLARGITGICMPFRAAHAAQRSKRRIPLTPLRCVRGSDAEFGRGVTRESATSVRPVHRERNALFLLPRLLSTSIACCRGASSEPGSAPQETPYSVGD